VIVSNDNWKDSPQREAIQASGRAPIDDREAAALITLAPGAYTAIVSGKNDGVGVGKADVIDVSSSSASRIANISSRVRAGTGENVMIGGFSINGPNGRRVILRGIGPSMGFSGSLSNPTLRLRDASGNILAFNDNWKDTQQQEIEATTIPPSHDLESAIVYTLAPGFYTAVMAGKNSATGIGVIEVYDLDQTANSQLANIASRGFVKGGDDVMIGGLIVGGTGTENARILLRAIGPSLGKAGIAGALQDPTLELRNENADLVRENDNWQESQQPEIEATTIPPSDPAEAAIIASLPSGNYTAVVRGKNNSAGVGLVEVYNVP
jgi:hypothetical protein